MLRRCLFKNYRGNRATGPLAPLPLRPKRAVHCHCGIFDQLLWQDFSNLAIVPVPQLSRTGSKAKQMPEGGSRAQMRDVSQAFGMSYRLSQALVPESSALPRSCGAQPFRGRGLRGGGEVAEGVK